MSSSLNCRLSSCMQGSASDFINARRRRAGWTAVVLGLAALAAGCQPDAAEQADAPVEPRIVWAEKVTLSDGVETLSFTGTVRPRVDAPMAFRVGGKLAERLADVGDEVAKGDVIARLDEGDYRHGLRVAMAQEKAAEAEAERTAADLERARELKEKGHASAAVFDRAKAAADAAREALTAARERRALAENELEYAVLKADADGVVTHVAAEPGEVVTAGQPVVRLARTGEREAAIAIPESRIGAVDGGRASVTLWALPGKRFEAKLRELSPEADRAARTFNARFSIDDPEGEAKLGMTATVHIARGDVERSFVVPLSSIWYRGEAAFVWRSTEDRSGVEAVPVTVRRLDEEVAYVDGELKPGELVASLGVHRLDENLAVRVEERAAGEAVQVGALR
ncbi:efflux RND transporter periplasmic adaptor subunit [Rhizobiales bacterium]|uniref:efflux RND transporter periplasmic adaptor subunit n=1 Tax=Hongsoonwoonella zoysiae TaxID=2821844 RepID=UPI00155FA871|nr:efflux RND transporter periplasmic adaptor subunit [Hongsoonwoonella zoysiae]NRG17969.1 efflux RND transporter periplasmic adaptor subunit [Hongsoonwoonella zoysiae]